MIARVLALWLALATGTGAASAIVGALPGAPSPDPELARRLSAALRDRGPAYRPHTRRVGPDGAPRYTNRLLLESSPYLLQHAHNPVDWYPWGEEAFARAAVESKPVLLSVGYSTCHWCHVMEDESFEDEEVATYLNQNYIAIKVDRESRPDVDDAYMPAVQMLTGSGGWPMTVWLTPGRQPFAAGTYFPKDRFLAALAKARAAFDGDPLRIATQAEQLTERLRNLNTLPGGEALPGAAVLRHAYARFVATFDAGNGGFGGAPKFPAPPDLDFLLRYHRHAAEPHALEMVVLTLERMAAGGIHDQVGGGFHRYATDAAWQVPHFEKMLSDNAQLALVYLAAFQLTKRPELAAVSRDVLDYLARDLRAPEGGYFAASDADSEGVEGKFFLWTAAEIRAVLDRPHADAVLAYYGVTDAGNFHGRTILRVVRPLPDAATAAGLPPDRLARLVDEARPLLYAARQRRVPPHVDTKIVAGWNGLAIAAFARAGAVLGEAGYVEEARTAARFILGRMRVDGRLARSWAAGAARGEGFLDDYAYLAAGLLELFEATSDPRWLHEAIRLHALLERDFGDPEGGGFFLAPARAEAPLGREKPYADGALPSGNAVAALNLLRLAELTGDDRLRLAADALLRAFAPRIDRAPAAFPALLSALDFRLDAAKEIALVRASGDGDRQRALLGVIRTTYVPNHVLAVATEGPDLARQRKLVPLLADKRSLEGRTTAYVCEQKVCALPTSDPGVLADQLTSVKRLAD